MTKLTYVETMSQRKNLMVENADAFIAMPGGLGTLEEIAEVLSWTKIGQNNGPCIFYNVNGFYNHIEMMIENMVEEGFLTSSYKDYTLFSDDLDEIDCFIRDYFIRKKGE